MMVHRYTELLKLRCMTSKCKHSALIGVVPCGNIYATYHFTASFGVPQKADIITFLMVVNFSRFVTKNFDQRKNRNI